MYLSKPRKFSPLCIAALLVLPILAGSCGGNGDTQANNNSEPGQEEDFLALPECNEIILEAENAEIEAPMIIKDDDVAPEKTEIHHASMGKFVHLPDKVNKDGGEDKDANNGKNDEKEKAEELRGKVVFNFEIEESDKYMLWARVNWLDGCGNSFYVVMDDGPIIKLGGGGTYRSWQWINIKGKDGKFRLSKGKHTLEIRNREDGASLDQILLTMDLDEDAQPQGILSQ
ncbi:MAG: hypothetical protein HQ592_02125 [Planctomycetes bacterium]|nr:hypothetical protein [Planctomycetota bacterium]